MDGVCREPGEIQQTLGHYGCSGRYSVHASLPMLRTARHKRCLIWILAAVYSVGASRPSRRRKKWWCKLLAWPPRISIPSHALLPWPRRSVNVDAVDKSRCELACFASMPAAFGLWLVLPSADNGWSSRHASYYLGLFRFLHVNAKKT